MLEQLGRLAKSALIYGTGDVLTKLIGFLLLPLFTAYLTPDDYGVTSILALVTYVLVAVFSLGLGTAIGVVYFDKTDSDWRSATLWSSVVIITLSGIVMVVFATSFVGEISHLIFRDAD